jgi:hypothetical protein
MLQRWKNRWTIGMFASILLGVVTIGIAGVRLTNFAHPPAVHAQAHGNADFWFLNETGMQVDRIYVSAHTQSDWGEDVLGSDAVLPHGVGVLITFPNHAHAQCSLDFKLVFHDNTTQTYPNGFNTCNLHAVIFKDGTADGY